MAKDIPSLNAAPLGDNARPVERMREELQTLLGFRGDALDAAITFRQAIERGLIDTLGRALTGSPSYTNVYPIGLGDVGASPDIDLTPPPTPTGLTVQAGFTQLVVQWAAPTYTTRSGTKQNAQTNVYAVKKDPADATLPTFEAGVTPRVFVAPGTLNVVSLPSELNTRWHVWIKFESVDGVESTSPAGGVNGYNLAGAFPTTGQDIAQLLGILTGQIRESQLYAALAEPIRSIVRRSDDAGEDALRAALATHQEAKRAVSALLAEAAARGTAITQTRALVAEGDAQLASQITTLTAAVATNRTEALAGIQTEETARANADSAEATARLTLAAEVHDPATGLAATLASLTTNYTTTAGMNSAIASSATTLTAAYQAADNAVYSSAQAYVATYAYAKSTVDSSLSSLSSTLTAAYQAADTAAISAADAAAAARDVTTLASANSFTYSRASIDSAISSSATTLTANYISADTAAVAAADAAAASRDVSVLASANSYTYSRASIDGAIASSASTLTAAYSLADSAVASAADAAAAARDVSVLAAANTFTYSQASIDSAISSSATTLTANYGAAIGAAVAIEASARATLDGDVRTLYTVRTEVSSGGRTVIGGFGLAGTAGGAEGPRIEFGIRADRFYVDAPAGSAVSTPVTPFAVQATSVTVNGVVVPAGVYMNAAYINNLSAMWVRFGTLIADSIAAGQISAANLTLGDGTVGGDLQSTSYAAGSGSTPGSGWKLTRAGTLYASGAVIYGAVYAAAGAIGGNTIDATGIQSPGYTVGSTGFRFDSSGVLRAFASAGSRVLDMAATGTEPVLKIGSALELLANGDAYFGGRLAVGTVSANGSSTSSASFPSLPDSTATYSTGTIAFSPAAEITGVGGNISAWVSCDIRVGAQSNAVDAIRVFAFLDRNGSQVDSSEVFLRSCVFPDPTGATRVAAAEVTLLSPLAPLTGLQTFTLRFQVKFYNSAGIVISPGPSAFTSYLQVTARANLQEIKV